MFSFQTYLSSAFGCFYKCPINNVTNTLFLLWWLKFWKMPLDLVSLLLFASKSISWRFTKEVSDFHVQELWWLCATTWQSFKADNVLETRGEMDYLSNKIQFLIYCLTSYLHLSSYKLCNFTCSSTFYIWIVVFTLLLSPLFLCFIEPLPSHPSFFVS